MSRKTATFTILEKVAVDNGFGRFQGKSREWWIWEAHGAPIRICMRQFSRQYAIGSDRFDVIELLDQDVLTELETPNEFELVTVSTMRGLHKVAGKIWRIARSLPNEPLRRYRQEIARLPDVTEVERMRKERIGQNLFREALLAYWDSRCAVTNIGETRLLRASHIIPWANCDSDSERLNVHNGLLLVAHLDAAFDSYLVSFDSTGRIIISPQLKLGDVQSLGLNSRMKLRKTDTEIELRLSVHRRSLLK